MSLSDSEIFIRCFSGPWRVRVIQKHDAPGIVRAEGPKQLQCYPSLTNDQFIKKSDDIIQFSKKNHAHVFVKPADPSVFFLDLDCKDI